MDGAGSVVFNRTNNAALDASPAWSPDGSKIAFASNRDGNIEVYTMNANGTGQTNISNNGAHDADVSWSPDGTKIAFASDRDGDFEIYTMNADGSGVSQITNNASNEGFAAWSPDGKKIAFHSDSAGDQDICYITIAGGSGITCLSTAGDQHAPSWKAGNESIAFQSQKPGDSSVEIYVWPLGGSAHSKITDNSALDSSPDWRRVFIVGGDFDLDGCTDAKEAHSNQMLGGRRNPQHLWDFFDTPDGSNVRDRAVAGTDFFRILARFNASGSTGIDPLSAPPGPPAYHTAFDRGPALAGQDTWDLTQANGSISGTDFFSILAQFGHNCA